MERQIRKTENKKGIGTDRWAPPLTKVDLDDGC
jgi:hypothetical protein